MLKSLRNTAALRYSHWGGIDYEELKSLRQRTRLGFFASSVYHYTPFTFTRLLSRYSLAILRGNPLKNCQGKLWSKKIYTSYFMGAKAEA